MLVTLVAPATAAQAVAIDCCSAARSRLALTCPKLHFANKSSIAQPFFYLFPSLLFDLGTSVNLSSQHAIQSSIHHTLHLNCDSPSFFFARIATALVCLPHRNTQTSQPHPTSTPLSNSHLQHHNLHNGCRSSSLRRTVRQCCFRRSSQCQLPRLRRFASSDLDPGHSAKYVLKHSPS